MILSKLGSFWRFLKEDVIPIVFALLFLLSFLCVACMFAYCLGRGWLILWTGDVDFLPPLSVFWERVQG